MCKRRLFITISMVSALGLGALAESAYAGGFDWMNPNKWFNNRDYDRDYYRGYNGYSHPGYGYPGYGYPTYGYPGYGYPAVGYPSVGYPGYAYPVQPLQNNSNATQAPAPAPTPQ